MSKKIAYEKHPVSPERREELINKGYKIIDVRFKPNGETKEPTAVDDMNVKELKQFLADNHVEFVDDAKKADLLELAKGVDV